MVNRKGYIKTLEAVIAIILIAVISYTLIAQHVETPPEPPLDLQGAMKFINEKIEFDENLRKKIVRGQSPVDDIASIINESKPQNYDFTCAICPGNICFIDTPLEKSIYVSDVFIASSEEKQDPQIVRIWFWKKPTKSEDLVCYSTCLNKCKQK